MVDFIVNVFAEVVDFFINFGVDNVIDKYVKGNKKISSVLRGSRNCFCVSTTSCTNVQGTIWNATEVFGSVSV